MRVVRTTVAIALTVVFLVTAVVALVAASPTLLGLIDGGCGTELCCENCRTIPVTRIIDGDTFVSNGPRIRLFGIDATEIGQRCATDATERLLKLAGNFIRVESGPRELDSFGRMLFYVYTESGDSVDETLIREGLAWAWRDDGQHRDRLIDLEDSARLARAGCLWSTSPDSVWASQASARAMNVVPASRM